MLLAIRNGETLVGIAPLLLERQRAFGVPVRVVKFLGGGVASSDHLDLILDPTSEPLGVVALLDYLNRYQGAWDLLDLDGVPSQSRTIEILLAEGPARGLSVSATERRICPYLPLPSTSEEFVRSLPRNLRHNLARYEKKLAQRGVVEFQLWKDPDALGDALDRFKKLHLKRREVKGDRGSFAYRGFEAFHWEFAGIALGQGWLRLAFLRVNDEAIAAVYFFKYRDITYAYQSGFDPRWADYSVGTLLLGHSIKTAIEERSREFDFLRGEGAYKSFWTDKVRRSLRVRLGNGSLSYKCFRASENVRSRAKELAKRRVPASWWGRVRRRALWLARS